jgi:hypothetical protein
LIFCNIFSYFQLMKVSYNKESGKISTDDIAIQNFQLLNISFGLNALVAILHLVNHDFDFSKAINGLVQFNFKRSFQKDIRIDDIVDLKSSTSINRLNYYILLKNRKKRWLHFGDDFESIEKLKLLIDGK